MEKLKHDEDQMTESLLKQPGSKKGIFPNSFKEGSWTQIWKTNRDIIRKENCRPVSLMNTDVKILNKILAS